MRLVPTENDVIPMVLLVNMHFIKRTWIIFSQVTWENTIGTNRKLVPVENDVIPMVLLVNMHFIKGTSIIFSQVTWENNLSPLNEMHIHQ